VCLLLLLLLLLLLQVLQPDDVYTSLSALLQNTPELRWVQQQQQQQSVCKLRPEHQTLASVSRTSGGCSEPEPAHKTVPLVPKCAS
jgi:hypothetical protein